MKRILATAIFALALAGLSHAQTGLVAVPSASTASVAITWTLGTGCAASTPCTVTLYRVAGTCPAQITGVASWTAIPVSGSQPTTYTDNGVSFAQTYSYVAEDALVSNAGFLAGPSNCVTVTLPNPPGAPVVSATAG